MSDRIYLNRAESIWVEATDTHVVVSWPYGHRSLRYEVSVPELLAVVGRAIRDTYEPVSPIRYPPRKLVSLEPESSEPSS